MTNNSFTAPAALIEGEYTVQPPAPPRPRRFLYDGNIFDDPGPQYSIRDVMNFLAQTYPELANGSWTKTAQPDHDLITFYKVTGEKGISPSDLLNALDSLPAEPLEAFSLTEELLELERQGGLTTDTLTRMSDSIQAAQQQMRAVEKMSALILDRVLHLPAAAHPRVPLGF
ncbi:MAG: hypothetical protein Kow0031_10960 [Anaerolineae bacterium]